MLSRFLPIAATATAAAMMPMRASTDISGIVGEGLGLLLGVAWAVADGVALAVAVGFAVEVGEGETVALDVGVGVAPALTTCTIPHMPNETCPGTGQI